MTEAKNIKRCIHNKKSDLQKTGGNSIIFNEKSIIYNTTKDIEIFRLK